MHAAVSNLGSKGILPTAGFRPSTGAIEQAGVIAIICALAAFCIWLNLGETQCGTKLYRDRKSVV